jgi:GWxTD domain-containing protein
MGSIVSRRGFFFTVAIFVSCTTFVTAQERPAGTGQNKAAGKPSLRIDGGIPIYKAWLQQDVVWIITDEELAAFKLLRNDEEKDNFIDAFWSRRNPTPDSFDNPFKDEHYRRIVYANEHFGSAIPGWKSDRGRIYIVYGAPDKTESYPAGKVPDINPPGGATSSLPLEVWHYRYLDGVGQDVVIEFVDVCKCGDYQMKVPPEQRDELFFIPGGVVGARGTRPQPGDVRPFITIGDPPKVKLKNLEETTNLDPKWKTLAFEVSADTVKATEATSLVPITIVFRNRDMTATAKDGSPRAAVNIFGRVVTLTGRIAGIFETTVEVDASSGPDAGSSAATTTLLKTLALRQGRYRVDIVAQEANGDRWGRWVRGVIVGD